MNERTNRKYLDRARVNRVFLALPLPVLLLLAIGATAALATGPEKIVGSDECGECHKAEVRAWRGSMHFKTFSDLSRRPEAREISQKLGIKRLKTESDCLQCHFTAVSTGGEVNVVEGVSCEACHGPSQDWVDIHSDYGGKDVEKEDESPEHRAQRIKNAEAKGMLRPEHIYLIADNCLGCHTVPNERLVNVGGHPAGSAFELVSWSQGEVRHNFLNSESNQPASQDRRRVLYVVGRGLELKHGLLAVAKATKKAEYAVEMAKRAKRATLRLQQIQEATPIPEVAEMISVANGAALKLNNRQQLEAAAKKVDDATRRFSESNDGSGLAAIDSLIPTKVKGTAAP